MLRFTERIGEYELVYEGETVQEIITLKKALNPSVLVEKDVPTTLKDKLTCGTGETPPLRAEVIS